jgi:hypothetical protein
MPLQQRGAHAVRTSNEHEGGATRRERNMANEIEPRIDEWYAESDTGRLFRVVALDGAAGLVEIQDFDGAVAELDREAWRELDIQSVPAPKDCSGPFDDVDAEDAEDCTAARAQLDWRLSLQSFWTAPERWQDTCTLIDLSEAQSNRLADLFARQVEEEEAAK